MKKFLGVLATVVLTAGLVSGIPSSATAGEYPANTVPTDTTVTMKRVARHKRPHVRIEVDGASNASPQTGRVKVCTRKLPGGAKECRNYVYRQGRNAYSGPRVGGRGTYKVIVVFTPRPGSRWKKSRDTIRTFVR